MYTLLSKETLIDRLCLYLMIFKSISFFNYYRELYKNNAMILIIQERSTIIRFIKALLLQNACIDGH